MTNATQTQTDDQATLVAIIKLQLAEMEVDAFLPYEAISARTGRPKHGPNTFEFALMGAMEQLEVAEEGRPPMFFLRCGKRGIRRVSANEAASQGLKRRRRHIVKKAHRGLSQARNLTQDPDLDKEHKDYLGAHAACLALVASAGRSHSGLGTGTPLPKATGGSLPDWDGLKGLYAPADDEGGQS